MCISMGSIYIYSNIYKTRGESVKVRFSLATDPVGFDGLQRMTDETVGLPTVHSGGKYGEIHTHTDVHTYIR